jgi:hypothetical protein
MAASLATRPSPLRNRRRLRPRDAAAGTVAAMPSLWTDDNGGHPWITTPRAPGPAAPPPQQPAPEAQPGLGPKAVLFGAACAVAAIAGAAIEVLR